MKRFSKTTLVVLILWFLGHTICIIADGIVDENVNADAIVVLGSKVNEDGTLSKRLEQRLLCGIEVYNKKLAAKIIVSGGLGKEGFWEGDKMKEFLLSKGIPDSCIIVDNKGNNTEATVVNSLKIADSLHFKSLIAVSQYFHVARVKKLYQEHHFEKIYAASPNYFEGRDLYSIVREFFAYYF